MTNGGLSLNAELFRMPSNHRDTDTLYLIKLNCSWAWPPLKAAWTPLVLFLRDPDSWRGHSDLAKIPLYFRKVQFSPQSWRMVDSGQWDNLGRHDILIAHDAAPARDTRRALNVANFRFIEPAFDIPAENHYHMARLATETAWTVLPADRPPKFIAENEAFIYTATTRSETGRRDQVGYLAIVKWNRWTRRGLTCGIWPLASPRGVTGATNRMIERLLDADREQPYQHTAPIVPELGGSDVANSVVMALQITAGRDTFGSGRRLFIITVGTEDLSEREGRAGEDVLPVVAKKGEEYNPYIYQQAESSDEAEWSDVSEDSQKEKATAKAAAPA